MTRATVQRSKKMDGVPQCAMTIAAHPNDVDKKRIERQLRGRRRYRYVRPEVVGDSDGYRIVSPCCSRNIDADGGIIDIALLQFDQDVHLWRLYRMDYVGHSWMYYAEAARIVDLLAQICEDPFREFWP